MIVEIIVSSLALAAAGWLVAGCFCGIELCGVQKRQRATALRVSEMESGIKVVRIW